MYGNGVLTRYANLWPIGAKAGELVEACAEIDRLGKSGRSA
jgi:murein DD-endopeptidase MepM/ murein hydrolase activator NlpD